MRPNARGDLPLHYAARRGLDARATVAVARAFPGASLVRNADGASPMHFAARYRAPAEAIEAVAEAMRVSAEDEAEEAEAVRERANPGDAGPGDKGFLDASPTGGGARVSPSPGKEKKIKIGGLPSLGPDADGYAPLHLAQGAGDDPDAIAALVRADPGSVLARDAGGCTPLHLAVGNGGPRARGGAVAR